MTDSNSKKALTLGVVVILIVVLAGAYFGMSKKPNDALPDTSEVAQEDITSPTAPPVATDSHGDAVPTTIEEPMVEETTDAAPVQETVSGEKVKKWFLWDEKGKRKKIK